MKKIYWLLGFLLSFSGVHAGIWSDVQASVDNSVVQIFSCVAHFNWLQPYQTPKQGTCRGSGFFIDDQGHIITNAHVVDQAIKVEIQLPRFGARRFSVDVVAFCPEYDLALLRLADKDLAYIKRELKEITYLSFGDSDYVRRSDDLLVLGYPLGQEALKSTTGVVSGREHIKEQHWIQMSAPINPGSSGGPVLNVDGGVVGVSCAGVYGEGAQNVGYIIPSAQVQLFLNHMEGAELLHGVKFIRTSFWHGILVNSGTDSLTRFLGNPLPGGLYVAFVDESSDLYQTGLRSGDMIYEIDGNRVDYFGDMQAWWSEDLVSIDDYARRCLFGDTIEFVVYRNGERLRLRYTVSPSCPAIRRWYPWHEDVDYEIIGGMVVMELTKNHLEVLRKNMPSLSEYETVEAETKPVLFISHLFPGSLISCARTMMYYDIIDEVNGENVRTLQEFRNACKKSVETGFLTVKTKESVFDAFDLDEILEQEDVLSGYYFYDVTPFVKELAQGRISQQ